MKIDDMKLAYQAHSNLNVTLNRQSYGPLDLGTVFNSKADLEYYRSEGQLCASVATFPEHPYPYAGQIVSLVDNETGAVSVYKLVPNSELSIFDIVQIDATVKPGDLPIASKSSPGAVKIGAGLDVTADGTISAQKLTVDSKIDSTTESSSNPVATKAVVDYVKGSYIPSTAANSPSSTDKLVKQSELDAKINGLDVAATELAPSKTVKTIKEEDGKIAVEIQDIQISKGQVTGLTADIDALDKTGKQLRLDVNQVSTDLDAAEATIASHATEIGKKLDASTFKQLSTDIGLSAASKTNPIVTKNDIADLAGAMHFRGVTTSDITTGSTAIPEGTGYYDAAAGKVPAAGDIVANVTTSKEFVWVGDKHGTASGTGRWIELGDESLYLAKTTANTLSTTLETKITALDGKIGTVSNDLDTLEASVAAFKKLAELSSQNLCAEVQKVANNYLDKTTANTLSTGLKSAIDEKIFVDGVSTKSLSIIHDTADNYHQKVVAGTVLENELYIISSDYINCYGEQIKNVAEPTDQSDAATKGYVDTAVEAAQADVTALSAYAHALSVSQLVWDIDTISCGNAN